MWAVWVALGAAGGIAITLTVGWLFAVPRMREDAISGFVRELAESRKTRTMTIAELWTVRQRQQGGRS